MRASFRSVPSPVLVLGGILSVQLGAGVAKGQLFDVLSPSAVVFYRLATSAVVLLLFSRLIVGRVLRGASRGDVAVIVAFGVVLATMNLAFYESISRIPLGIAVTIEFLGPLGVAVALSRRRLDLMWVALAGLGVALLSGGGSGDLDPVGVGLALVAAACWAAYILLSVQTGRRFTGSSGLALASVVGTVVLAPIGLSSGGSQMWQPDLLALGIVVGLLSSAIPYALELEALRRLPARTFGILMSLEPAVAALVGLVVLGESLQLREVAAIGCVVAACLGTTRTRRQQSVTPNPGQEQTPTD
ncbi:MAG TPA: EamA family transporter [Jiangellaceae bacterium]|nr:EamA family transporter [Jiangellaceae bacterium]